MRHKHAMYFYARFYFPVREVLAGPATMPSGTLPVALVPLLRALNTLKV